jgi:hypothetical protein
MVKPIAEGGEELVHMVFDEDGAFAGYVLLAVMNEKGLFFRWGLFPGNARETPGLSFWRGFPPFWEIGVSVGCRG